MCMNFYVVSDNWYILLPENCMFFLLQLHAFCQNKHTAHVHTCKCVHVHCTYRCSLNIILSLHSFGFIGDSSFASTLTHLRMSKCHGIDVSYSKRVMECSQKQKGMCMYESSMQELLLEFTKKCRRYVYVCIHDTCSSRLSLNMWMWLQHITYVCVDSSQTVLEHHRPFHSRLC